MSLVQTLDEAIFVSAHNSGLEDTMNQSLLSSSMGKIVGLVVLSSLDRSTVFGGE